MNARMLAALLMLPAALVPFGARASAPKPTSVQIVVRALLPLATSNFASFRLERVDYDTDFAQYKTKTIGHYCKACKLYDQYARGSYKENWYVEDEWDLSSNWKPEQLEKLATTQLRPLLTGFALKRTPLFKGSKYVVLMWRGPHGVWVRARTFDSGYTVRVGHDLAKAVHVLRPPTQAQLKQLSAGTANVVQLAAPSAPTNFENLRTGNGAKNELGDLVYQPTVTFGPIFRKCDISNLTNSFGFADFQPKWVLSCQTVALAATAASLKDSLRAAVETALPEGFSATTDPGSLLLDDYRWDKSDVSIDISSDDENGAAHFDISIYHYLPKEPAN